MSMIAVPSKLDEKMLYIWKIIDRTSINWKELVYFIAFDLHLTTPESAKKDILEAVKQGILKATPDYQLSLNTELQNKFDEFQKQGILKYRKMLGKLKDSWGPGPESLQKSPKAKVTAQVEQKTPSETPNPESSESAKKPSGGKSIDAILEQLTAKTTVQTGLKIDNADITFETLNFDAGIISGKIQGSEGKPYNFLIDAQTKILSHDCVDFSMKRARKKEICKHLVKVLEQLLKNPNQNAKKIVEQIVNDKMNWKFNG